MRKNRWAVGAVLAVAGVVCGLGSGVAALSGSGTFPGARSGAQARDALSDSPELGRVLDREGVAARRAVLARRFTALDAGSALSVGDWLEVGRRGANALRVRLEGGAELTLGPGTLVELMAPGRVRALRGELEVDALESAGVEVLGAGDSSVTVTGRDVLRSDERQLTRIPEDPAWLKGYESNASTEALGSLLANVDGRNVPLTIGYHKVTVDVRDQIARTVIEESFVNHTSQVLEGVFYFPLPADASISGFGMWIGNELVQGDIVEKQRAREIYEEILREKRDPGLLEWAGGNLFKARVYPIGSEKRIRIAYTQVLAKTGDTFAYHYALQSEMLRTTPLQRLEIEVNVSSLQQLASVESPSHTCRIRTTEHAARVEFSAEEFVPERDFELRVQAVPGGDPGAVGITVVPHQRGDDGYFMLLVDAPAAAALEPRSARPLELLVIADTSGSMWGAPRANQIAVVETLISALGEGDTFNLATCDVQTRWAFPRPVAGSDQARGTALDFLEARDPLGWSDLEQAFAAAFERAGPTTQVVYVGDGVPTAGAADPVALAQSLARLYRGAGSFHAIVPGSTSEMVVLRALARLGGGSVRSIGGGTDPAQTAFALLAEITTPSVRDLALEFEGLPVAAVYPTALPNLPTGSQQVVVGRFDPASARGLRGSVRISGTLDGEPLHFESPLDLSTEGAGEGFGDASGEGEDGAGNAFVPRLWARHHLDHLLDQGRSPEVRERIIALSEDYQIVTPYSSFLVLESDADRERFGVQKGFRMRDGEEFFQAGRDDATHALRREQMLAARGWRRELREAVLLELRDMGRGMTEWLEHDVFPLSVASQLGALGYAGGDGGVYRGPGDALEIRESEGFADGSDEDVPFDAPLEPAAEGDDSTRQRPGEADEMVQEEMAAGKSVMDRRERVASPAPSRGNLGYAESKKVAGGRLDWNRSWYVDPFEALLPGIGAPRTEPTALPWSADVLEVLATLDRRPRLATGADTWRIDVDSTWRDARGRASLTSGRTFLSSSEWVAVAQHVEGQEYAVDWSLGGERGVLLEGFRLGRVRPAVAGDRGAWSAPFGWHFGDQVAGYASYEARLRHLEAGRALVELRPPGPGGEASWLALEIDVARGLLVSETWFHEGQATRGRTFADFQEVGGLWWPGTIRSWQAPRGVDQEDSVARVRVERSAQSVAELARADLVQRETGLLLAETLVSLPDAKRAAASGQAGLDARWTLLRHFGATQRWDLARPHFDAFGELAAGRPGLDLIRLTWLQQSRRNEELRAELRRQIERQVTPARGGALEAGYGVANRWLGYLGGLEQGGEVLELLDLLRPVYEHADAILDAELPLDERRLNALASMNRPEEHYRARRAAAVKWPFALGMQTALVQLAAQRGEVDEALAWLDHVEEDPGAWQDHERTQLRHTRLDVLWNSYRLEAVVDTVEAWDTAASGVDTAMYDRYLAALVMLDREAVAGAAIDSWLSAARLVGGDGRAVVEHDARAAARLQAAIQHCLGQGYQLYRQRLDERDLARLDRTARSLVAREGSLHMAGQIVQHWQFRETDLGQRLLLELLAELVRDVDEVAVPRLVTLLGWLGSSRPTSDDFTTLWTSILARVHRRWIATDDPSQRDQLLGALLAHGDVELRLDCRRRLLAGALDEDARVAAAEALFAELIALPWSADVQREARALLATMRHADETEAGEREGSVDRLGRLGRLDRRILALYRFVNWMLDARTRALLEAQPGYESMSRRTLQAARSGALSDVRAETIGILAELEETLGSPELRRWATIERAFLEVQGRVDLDGAWERALALLAHEVTALAAADGDEAPLRTGILAARSASTCTYLLLSTDGARLATRTAELTAQLEQLVRAESALPDGRTALRNVWLALDRGDELEAALADWFAGGEDFERVRWGRDYAHVLAERGQLERAVEVIEGIGRFDELERTDLVALADWYTALDRPELARDARARSYAVMDESQLSGALYADSQRAQRHGEGVPEELADDVPDRLVVLLTKARAPQQYFWQLRELYAATKDFRLLECLARGVMGQSAQGIYPFLNEVAGLAQLIDEEATVDRVLAGIEALREQAATDVDRRALWLLEFQIVPRATHQSHGVERHVERARRALESSFRGEWQQGEPLLMADLLANQGALQPESLAAEQLRQLRALVALCRDPEERLAVSQRLASTLWLASRRDEATRTLEAALREFDAVVEGALPQAGREALAVLSSWLASSGSYRRAEEFWLAELGESQVSEARLWLEQQLLGLYQQALYAGAEVSLGRGDALFAALLARIDAALDVPTQEHHAAQQVSVLCELYGWRSKSGEREAALELAADFAFTRLPDVLRLYQYRSGQRMVGQVADTLRQLGAVATAVEFLVVRAETEPAWLERQSQDFWQQHAWRLGHSISETRGLPKELERRVLAIVLAELNEDLRSRRSRNRGIYDHRHSDFWSAKRADFLRAATAFVEAQSQVPQAIVYAAEYLFDGLGAYDEAIDALGACYRRGNLHLEGRDRLASYLQLRTRWGESLPLCEELVAEAPSEVRYHVMALLAHARTGDRPAAGRALARAEAWFRAHSDWSERVIANLADGCRQAGLAEESLPLYDDAIALHVRSRADRGVGDGVLSMYYRQQADVYAALGRTAQAVDAAAGAIVSWGSSSSQRWAELENLVDVLARAADLEGYVRQLDAEVRASGLENPIVRRALGEAWLRRGDPRAAAPQFALAVEARPDDLENYQLLVRAYDELQRPDLALPVVLAWSRVAGHDWSLIVDLGRRLAALEDSERAERAFTNLAELSAEESEGHAELARVREGQRRWSDAALAWRHVIRVRTSEPTGYFGLARAFLELGDLDQARAVAEELLATRWPERFGDVHDQARRLLEELRAGR